MHHQERHHFPQHSTSFLPTQQQHSPNHQLSINQNHLNESEPEKEDDSNYKHIDSQVHETEKIAESIYSTRIDSENNFIYSQMQLLQNSIFTVVLNEHQTNVVQNIANKIKYYKSTIKNQKSRQKKTRNVYSKYQRRADQKQVSHDTNSLKSFSQQFQVESIKGSRTYNKQKQYLIKWKNFPDYHDWTWETLANLWPIKNMIRQYEHSKKNKRKSRKGQEWASEKKKRITKNIKSDVKQKAQQNAQIVKQNQKVRYDQDQQHLQTDPNKDQSIAICELLNIDDYASLLEARYDGDDQNFFTVNKQVDQFDQQKYANSSCLIKYCQSIKDSNQQAKIDNLNDFSISFDQLFDCQQAKQRSRTHQQKQPQKIVLQEDVGDIADIQSWQNCLVQDQDSNLKMIVLEKRILRPVESRKVPTIIKQFWQKRKLKRQKNSKLQ